MGKHTYFREEDEEPSMDCTSPVSAHDLYVPDHLQSGYRPSQSWASPRTSKNVSSKFTECGFRPRGLKIGMEEEVVEHNEPKKTKMSTKQKHACSVISGHEMSRPSSSQSVQQNEDVPKVKKQKFLFEETRIAKKPREPPTEYTEKPNKQKKSKHDAPEWREMCLDTPSTSQTEQETVQKPKKQRFLFEDTPMTHREARNVKITYDNVSEFMRQPIKYLENKHHKVISPCLESNVPCTSRNATPEPKSKKRTKHERISFEIIPSESILDDMDTSNEEASEVREQNTRKRSREKSVQPEQLSFVSTSLIDTPSTSKASIDQDKCYRKPHKKSLFDKTVVEDILAEDLRKEPRSEKKQLAKSEYRSSIATPDRRKVEEPQINGNRPKKKRALETPIQEHPSTSGLGPSATIHRIQPTAQVLREVHQRLEHDTRPKERLQRLEKADMEDKRKKKDSNNNVADVRTLKIRKPPAMTVEKEIRAMQKSTRLIIDKKPFKRLVKEITTEVSGKEYRHSKDAIEALQESAEQFLVEMFQFCRSSAQLNGRETIDTRDVQLVRIIKNF